MALNLKTWMQNLHDGSYDNPFNARKSVGINAAKGGWSAKDKEKALAAVDAYFQTNLSDSESSSSDKEPSPKSPKKGKKGEVRKNARSRDKDHKVNPAIAGLLASTAAGTSGPYNPGAAARKGYLGYNPLFESCTEIQLLRLLGEHLAGLKDAPAPVVDTFLRIYQRAQEVLVEQDREMKNKEKERVAKKNNERKNGEYEVLIDHLQSLLCWRGVLLDPTYCYVVEEARKKMLSVLVVQEC